MTSPGAWVLRPGDPLPMRSSPDPSLPPPPIPDRHTPMEFTLNGQAAQHRRPRSATSSPTCGKTAGLLSPKDGCSGRGRLRLLHGAGGRQGRGSVAACAMKEVAGKDGHHPGGARPPERDAFADGFVLKGGVQCGFCTPGIVMKAAALLQRNPEPYPPGDHRRTATGTCAGAPATRRSSTPSIAPPRPCAADGRWPFPDGHGRRGHPPSQVHGPGGGAGRSGCSWADMVEPGMVFGALRFSTIPGPRC